MAQAGRYAEWLRRGREHQWARRPVDAMLCFQRAASLDPRAVDPRYLLGEVQWQLGAIPAAVAAWRDAARVGPGHLASHQALAEALLAIADVDGAADAADAAIALAPDDAATRVLHVVTMLAAGRDASVAATLPAVIGGHPSRLVSPVTGGTLARVLSQTIDAPATRDILAALVAHRERITFALLAPLAHGAISPDAPQVLREALPSIVDVALRRAVTPLEIDALREIALACHAGGEAGMSQALATRYAEACVALAPAGAPLRWPSRTAGPLRAVVLLGASEPERAVSLLREVAAQVPDVEWTLLAAADVPAFERSTVRIVGAIPGTALAAGLAEEDPDVLVDMGGLAMASGPLLALRPAYEAVSAVPGGPPQRPPLVDRAVDADVDTIVDALAAARERAAKRSTSGLPATEIKDLFARAVKAHQSQAIDDAVDLYRKVLDEQTDHAPTLHLLAALYGSRDRGSEARALLGRALDVAPAFADARASLARMLRDEGSIDAARTVVESGLAIDSHSIPLWRVRGELELAADDPVAAQAAFETALALAPTDAEAHYNFGVALQKQARHSDAARAYQRALAFDPDFVDAHFNLAVVFRETGHAAAAITAYRAVLERDPRRVSAYSQLGEALLGTGRIDEWLANFRRFEKQCPEALPLAVQALEACQYAADSGALERYLEGLRRERFRVADATELTDAIEQLLYLLLFFDVEPEMLHSFSQTYAATAPQVYGAPLTPRAVRAPGRIRVGYLSGDLRNHVMGKMMWHALRHHDRARFDVRLYSTSATRDEWTQRFETIADQFHVVAGLSDKEAAGRMIADDLDILVDLSGHTKGGRPGILARKPARVQMTHVASAGSVGLDTVDFKLTDAFADVPDNQQWSIETLLAMAGCVYPYRRIEPSTPALFDRTALGLDADRVVIGAFVTPMKLSRRCLSLWREALERVPRAILAFSPTSAALRPVFERLCAASGIARERLLFLPQGRNDAENQSRYAIVDFVLDPMPFGGVNGVLEPLDAGVPVVTLVGKRHGERSAYSILRNLGVTHTVAHSGREYVDLAVRLAGDEAFRREVRAAIQAGLRASPLVDMPAHTRNLEAAYIEALRRKAPDVLAGIDG